MKEEYLDIVDENDKVIGKDTKSNKLEKELISRNVAVFIKDSHGNYINVKRAPVKKSFPNRLDLAACGNVKSGESYEHAASREIREETGFSCSIKLLRKVYNEEIENNKKRKYFTSIFLAQSDDKITLNKELSHYEKMALTELKQRINSNPELFCPFFLKDFKAVEDLLE